MHASLWCACTHRLALLSSCSPQGMLYTYGFVPTELSVSWRVVFCDTGLVGLPVRAAAICWWSYRSVLKDLSWLCVSCIWLGFNRRPLCLLCAPSERWCCRLCVLCTCTCVYGAVPDTHQCLFVDVDMLARASTAQVHQSHMHVVSIDPYTSIALVIHTLVWLSSAGWLHSPV